MRRWKRFFGIPLNKLWGKLPRREKREEKKLGQEFNKIPQVFLSSGYELDQRAILEILKIIKGYQDFEKMRGLNVIVLGRQGMRGTYFRPYNRSYEELDSIYQDLAPQISIRTRVKRKSLSLPVVEYGYENFNISLDNPQEINFNHMVADIKSPFKEKLGRGINFQVAKHHYFIDVCSGMGKRGFPDVCLLLDTSGSMRDRGYHSSIPWGEQSSYHYALLGWYGIMKYLELEGIASSIYWNIINFSDYTRASGWRKYQEIGELKKHALTPQFGGTEIDIEVLREQLNRRSCLLIMLSDGKIYNWESIKVDFEEILDPHLCLFIQIGKETEIGKDMQDFGAVVLTVKDKEDLAELMVDLTRKVRGYFR
ncbi:hypothetical protein J7M02_00160 [Candidatus Aerophobetes bacterium]|nr:hypothetical protein [Candidatus Aerophobetes bacterium]